MIIIIRLGCCSTGDGDCRVLLVDTPLFLTFWRLGRKAMWLPGPPAATSNMQSLSLGRCFLSWAEMTAAGGGTSWGSSKGVINSARDFLSFPCDWWSAIAGLDLPLLLCTSVCLCWCCVLSLSFRTSWRWGTAFDVHALPTANFRSALEKAVAFSSFMQHIRRYLSW